MKRSKGVFELFLRSFKNRLILVYTVFMCLIGLVFFISGILAYQRTYYSRATEYIQEITNQTGHNLQQSITRADFLSYSILANTNVQAHLKTANRQDADSKALFDAKSGIWNELISLSQSSNGLNSLSVFSLTGLEYTYQKSYGRAVEPRFEPDMIYHANGSLIWRVLDDGRQISAARAILSLETMRPIGYIYMVFEESSILALVEDIADTCSADAFLLDADEAVLVARQRLDDAAPVEAPATLAEIRLNRPDAVLFQGATLSNGWRVVLAVPPSTFWSSIYDFIYIILLATGKGKAKAIAEAIKGNITPKMPASLLQVHPNVQFLLDEEAASLL